MTSFDNSGTTLESEPLSVRTSTPEVSFSGDLTMKIRQPFDDEEINILLDVNMSPKSQQSAAPTCLTPSEWRSVNDMPRVNRKPFSSQTQRITPLKERARKGKQKTIKLQEYHDEHLVLNSSGLAATTFDCSTSSNCSSISVNNCNLETCLEMFGHSATTPIGDDQSAENCNQHINNSKERSGAHLGDLVALDTEEECDDDDNNNCYFSDISSRDEQYIDGVMGSSLIYSNSAPNSDTVEISGDSDCGLIDLNVEDCAFKCSSDSDSDSDNDLGQFYTPSPQMKSRSGAMMASSIGGQTSLGYISSYPSAGTSKEKDSTSH